MVLEIKPLETFVAGANLQGGLTRSALVTQEELPARPPIKRKQGRIQEVESTSGLVPTANKNKPSINGARQGRP